MDNKRWGKRFSTIFWWSLTILPLILALIYFIGYHFTFNSGITSAIDLANYHSNANGDFTEFLSKYLEGSAYSPFRENSLGFINQMFLDLWETFPIDDSSTIPYLLGWMASVQFYHVIYDVCVWIFRLIHSWLDRWCVE